MTTTVARVIERPDLLLAQLREQLAEALTPEHYDQERASALQIAIAECQVRSTRRKRMRRAALHISNSTKEWWY